MQKLNINKFFNNKSLMAMMMMMIMTVKTELLTILVSPFELMLVFIEIHFQSRAHVHTKVK